MVQSKIKTYIGFCIKSGKITLGSNAIATIKGGVYLLILDEKAAKNSLRYALKYKNKFNCPLIIYKGDFEEAVNKPLCRLAAIRDRSLANAILGSDGTGYELYIGGDK